MYSAALADDLPFVVRRGGLGVEADGFLCRGGGRGEGEGVFGGLAEGGEGAFEVGGWEWVFDCVVGGDDEEAWAGGGGAAEIEVRGASWEGLGEGTVARG